MNIFWALSVPSALVTEGGEREQEKKEDSRRKERCHQLRIVANIPQKADNEEKDNAQPNKGRVVEVDGHVCSHAKERRQHQRLQRLPRLGSYEE
jgi:hypothetical protein